MHQKRQRGRQLRLVRILCAGPMKSTAKLVAGESVLVQSMSTTTVDGLLVSLPWDPRPVRLDDPRLTAGGDLGCDVSGWGRAPVPNEFEYFGNAGSSRSLLHAQDRLSA